MIEFKTYHVAVTQGADIAEKLNEVSKEGWELTKILQSGAMNYTLLVQREAVEKES